MIYYDKWYRVYLSIIDNLILKGWTYCSSGKERAVYRRGNVVIKIALTSSGVIANNNEHILYRESIKNRSNSKYAACRLVTKNILMMRYVKPLDDLDPCQSKLIPDWAYNICDGPQVGIDLNGTILAYDYADELSVITGNKR